MLNPIFALEVRARWRSGRSFLLLLGITIALALLAGFIYQRALVTTASASFNPMSGTVTPAPSNTGARAGAIGRELFVALSHVNILAWLLLATASAATGIARERERGLLESLQLSRISAPAQIGARWGANLMFLSALQLVLLPIYAVAFVLGGISPTEVSQAFFLVMWAAITGTSLGLWFSARAHRPTNALFGALGAIALFSLAIFYDTEGGMSLRWGLAGHQWLYLFHPTVMFAVLTDPNFVWLTGTNKALQLFTLSHFAFGTVLLWSALRNVNRTLSPAAWQTNAAWVEKLRARQSPTPLQLSMQTQSGARAQSGAPSKAKPSASGALLTDLPLDRFVRFSDPLLAREVKARFRLRRAGFWVGLIRFALFLAAAGVWLFEVFWLFDAPSREAMVPYGLRVLLYGGTLCLGVLAATSWTRERESGTWEALKLSLLTPRQILRAKWMSPLVSFAYYAAPLLILMPIGAFYVPFMSFAQGAFVVTAWLGLAVALGLWMSWRVSNGTAAIAWTVGLLMGVLVVAPYLDSMLGLGDSLATWRYGVSGWRDLDMFSPYGRSRSSETVNRLYQTETGRGAPKPVTMSRPGSVMAVSDWSEWENFRRWGDGRIQSAEIFKARLEIWHPGELLNRMFAESDQRNISGYRSRQSAGYRSDDVGAALALSALTPLALTLILLMLLRRDVRREQLNA